MGGVNLLPLKITSLILFITYYVTIVIFNNLFEWAAFYLSLFFFFFCQSPSVFYLQGSGGITIKKTGQALVFGIYEEPVTPGQCNMVVERLGDYLIDQGL